MYPVEPEYPVAPVYPVYPVYPVGPVEPEYPVTPVYPVYPVYPVGPVYPVTPVAPNCVYIIWDAFKVADGISANTPVALVVCNLKLLELANKFNFTLSPVENVFVIWPSATYGIEPVGITYVFDESAIFVPFNWYKTVAFAVLPPVLNNCNE